MLQQLTQPKKWLPWFYMALLAMTIVVMAMLHKCAGQQGTTTARHSGGDTIDVAIEYSPTSYYTYADTLGGFNYDLLRLIAQRSGRPMKFYPIVTLHVAQQQLNDGRFDLLVAQFPTTIENKNQYLFTQNVSIDRQVLVQRVVKQGQLAVKSQLDLAGKTVWVVKGSPMLQRVRGLSREIGDTIIVKSDPVYGPEQLFLKVASGEIDYAVINAHIAKQLAEQYKGKVDMSKDVSFSQFQGFALKRGNHKLCDWLNKHITAIKADTLYKSLATRYGIEPQ